MRFRRRECASGPATFFFWLSVLCAGCASPGAPKPPSLQVSDLVSDLSVARSGGVVEVRFTGPSRTTDGLGVRGVAQALLCRASDPGGPCRPVDASEFGGVTAVRPGQAVTWTDRLTQSLTVGPPRPLAYRVELRNGAGRSAGMSEAAYVAGGDAPPPVSDLRAAGTRAGVLIRWTAIAGGGEVLLERRQLRPPPAAAVKRREQEHAGSRPAAPVEPGVVWLQAEPGNAGSAQTLDGTVREDVGYAYRAVRRVVAQADGRTLELRSAPSAPVEMTWRDLYPPPAPEGLTALGFTAPLDRGSAYAVDLVWQPVSDTRVTGYLVRRMALTSTGTPEGESVQLTRTPVVTPGFHDATASRVARYRYEVVAVDAKGNASTPAVAVVQAMAR